MIEEDDQNGNGNNLSVYHFFYDNDNRIILFSSDCCPVQNQKIIVQNKTNYSGDSVAESVNKFCRDDSCELTYSKCYFNKEKEISKFIEYNKNREVTCFTEYSFNANGLPESLKKFNNKGKLVTSYFYKHKFSSTKRKMFLFDLSNGDKKLYLEADYNNLNQCIRSYDFRFNIKYEFSYNADGTINAAKENRDNSSQKISRFQYSNK